MIMGNSSFVGIIIYGLWIALVITLPVLVIIVVVRAIRRMVTPLIQYRQILRKEKLSEQQESGGLNKVQRSISIPVTAYATLNYSVTMEA